MGRPELKNIPIVVCDVSDDQSLRDMSKYDYPIMFSGMAQSV